MEIQRLAELRANWRTRWESHRFHSMSGPLP